MGNWISLIELGAVFGLFMAVCFWQLRSLDKLDREDAEREGQDEKDR